MQVEQSIVEQVRNEIAVAMDNCKPFSWIKGNRAGDVQAGVFLQYSQAHFTKYELPKRSK